MEGKADICLTVLYLAAVLSPSQEIAIYSFCGIGGVFSSYIGARYFNSTGKSFFHQWLINFILTLMLGPFCVSYIAPKFPLVPLPFISLAVAFLLGTIGFIGGIFLLTKYGIKNGKNGSQDTQD